MKIGKTRQLRYKGPKVKEHIYRNIRKFFLQLYFLGVVSIHWQGFLIWYSAVHIIFCTYWYKILFQSCGNLTWFKNSHFCWRSPRGGLFPLDEEGSYGSAPRALPRPLPGYQKRDRRPKVYASYAVSRSADLTVPCMHCKDTIQKIRNKFLRKGTARLQSQFLHSCFCERFIYSSDRSAYY